MTEPGQPITKEDQELVDQLKEMVSNSLSDYYGSHDFNILRWIIHARKLARSPDKIIVTAERLLQYHLNYRKAWKLDDVASPNWEHNPLFIKRLCPKGVINTFDRSNRLVWLVDYADLDIIGISKTVKSSDIFMWCVWQFEHMLRLVMEQERKTERLSGIYHIADLDRVVFNPFTAKFISDGQMAHLTQFMHFDMYPELVNPLVFINSPRWAYWAHRLMRLALHGPLISRIHALSRDFIDELQNDVPLESIPDFYGGAAANSDDMRTIPMRQVPTEEYFLETDQMPEKENCMMIQISGRRRKFLPILVETDGCTITWLFKSDAEVTFGIFLQHLPPEGKEAIKKQKKDIEQMDMVVPFLRLAARFVPEAGTLSCANKGIYYLVFCNKQSWWSRRTIYLDAKLTDGLSVEIPASRFKRSFSL